MSAQEEGAHLYFEIARITPQILLQIYPQGFFPWYSEGEAIRCFNPATRCILYPPRLYIASRTVRYARALGYSSARDRDFRGVIDYCATVPRAGQTGTWITRELHHAFCQLHSMGWAHSFEVYRNNALCGGVYGLWMGDVFYGESMFSLSTQASLVALSNLCAFAQLHGIRVIDCQMETAHLIRHGAEMITRAEFMQLT